MASPHDLLYCFPDLAVELIAKYYPTSHGHYKFPFVDVQFSIDQLKRHIKGECGPIQPHTVLGSLAFYSHPGHNGGVQAINDILMDMNNEHVIEEASASWQEYKVHKRRYRTLRKNVVRFFMEETRPLAPDSRPPYEYKTDSERRAWLQNYVELLEEYNAFMLGMHAKMAKLAEVPDNDDMVGPQLPSLKEEEWRRRCLNCGGFGVGVVKPECVMCTHCQLLFAQRRRHRVASTDSNSSDAESSESDKIVISRPWWRCGVCTLDNLPSCDVCAVCTFPRDTPGVVEEKRPIPPPPPPPPSARKPVLGPPPPPPPAQKPVCTPVVPPRVRIEAKNGLEKYCVDMRSALDSNAVKSKLPADRLAEVNDKITWTLSWLHRNELADKEEFEEKQQELERVCTVCLPGFMRLHSLASNLTTRPPPPPARKPPASYSAPTQQVFTNNDNVTIEAFFEDVFQELSEESKRQKVVDAALRRHPRSASTSGDRKHQLLGIIRDGFSKRGEPVPLAIPSMTIEQLERVVKVWKLQEKE